MARVVDEARTLLAEKNIRVSAALCAVNLLLVALTLGAAMVPPTSGPAWFFAGVTTGCGAFSVLSLAMAVARTRAALRAEDAIRPALAMVAEFLNRELQLRGRDFEAVLRPGLNEVVIQRRGAPPPPPPSYH